MFKKNISAAGSHALGGKDVKSLRRDILKQYNSITEEQLNEILPSKANVTLTKLNNRCQVYGIEGGNPLFFDPDGRGSLLPTVYTLWAFPAVLPTLHTWSEVSPKILGGADLFLQGVLIPEGGLPDWLANSVRTVSVPGNPCPLGIGRMAVSRIEAAREGMKGRGLQLIHHYPDLLWAMGDRSVPNEGFTPQRVFPLKTQPTSDDSAPPAGASSATQEPADGSGAAAEATEEAGRQLQGLTLMQGAEDVASGGGSAADAAGTAEGQQGEPPSMDALLEEAALRGLKRVTNAELPMQTGDFYTKHMLACKPEGVVFDFKQSSFKKLSKLVDRLEKDKVLTQKVIRKQDNITAVNRQHPRLQALGEEEAAAATPAAARPGGGNGAGGAPSNGGAAVQVTYCYRAPSSLRPVFGAAGRDKERLYSEGEVEAALREYATSAGLLGGAAGQDAVQLDQLLHGALYNKKEPEKTGDTVPLRDVLRRLRDKLQLHHRLVRPGAQGGDVAVVRKGLVKPVHIADERRSGRDVTKVAHLESFALAPEELAGVFQKKFQCSATVSKLPGKQESDMEVMLQGKLARQVADFLTASYGIPPPFLEVKAGKK